MLQHSLYNFYSKFSVIYMQLYIQVINIQITEY